MNGRFTTFAFQIGAIFDARTACQESTLVLSTFSERRELLTYEEITTVVQSMLLGFAQGSTHRGEPLLHQDLTALIEMLRRAGPDLDLALTTNGALLARHAADLKQAGLDRARQP